MLYLIPYSLLLRPLPHSTPPFLLPLPALLLLPFSSSPCPSFPSPSSSSPSLSPFSIFFLSFSFFALSLSHFSLLAKTVLQTYQLLNTFGQKKKLLITLPRNWKQDFVLPVTWNSLSLSKILLLLDSVKSVLKLRFCVIQRYSKN